MLARILLVAAGALTAASAQEVQDRHRIFEDLAGADGGVSRTRSIVPEASPGPSRAEPSGYVGTSLPAVQFEYDSARLTNVAERQLRELGAALRMQPLDRARFALQGHTDSRGGAAYNRDLSLRRANSVTQYLTRESGISLDRLVTVGVGEDIPLPGIAPDDPANRRVEVIRLGAGAAAGSPGDAPSEPDSRALLVGIDAYPAVSTLLGAPINDVSAMRRFVQENLGYRDAEIRTLLDDEATRENILQSIENWLLGGDRALLYFSGHGFYQPDADGDEADGLDETLVPYDVTVENGVANGMITDDEIDRLLAAASGVVDVVIDSCHSGTVTRSAAPGLDWRFVKTPRLPDGTPLTVNAGTRGVEIGARNEPGEFVDSTRPNVTVWSAVGAKQKALVDATTAPQYVSVFTRRLVSGADGAADNDGDSVITSRELRAHVLRESEAYCQAESVYCADGLTPELSIVPDAIDHPAFARRNASGASTRSLAIASLAKDILVSPSSASAAAGADAVRIGVLPAAELTVGQQIEITVDSDADGNLVLLDIDAEGRMTQIFPNEWSDAQRVARGVPVTVPGRDAGFRLRAQPPRGTGRLVAVVAETELPGSLLGMHKDLAVIPRADAYVVELAGLLRRWNDGGWAYGEVEYEITQE